MHDDTDSRNHWPRFELAYFATPTVIPHGWDAELLRQGAPKEMFGGFVAARELMLLEVPTLGPFVCFASNGLFGRVCLDPRTGAVVEIMYDSTASVPLPEDFYGVPIFINSSLDQFIASVRAVIARFPFDSSEEEEKERYHKLDEAVAELRETLRAIDPAAVVRDATGWMTFLDDVQMGNYSTETILSNDK